MNYTKYQEGLLKPLRAACPLVAIRATWGVQAERWFLAGVHDGLDVILVDYAALNRACVEFRKAYERAKAAGMLKESDALGV